MQTSKDNDEDVSILEEDNPQIYAHLDNVLVHMINVMTDNISCLTHFPKDKTECKVDSLNIYFETLFHNKVYMKNCSLSPFTAFPKIKSFAQLKHKQKVSQQTKSL